MAWNYRLMIKKSDRIDYEWKDIGIYEVHYDKNDQIIGWTDQPVVLEASFDIVGGVYGDQVDHISRNDAIDSLKYIVDNIRDAINKPVLCHDTGKEI